MVNPYACCSLVTDMHLAADFSFQQAATIHHSNNVLSIVPGDFRHIGKLDILVMSQTPGLPNIDMTLYHAPSFSTHGYPCIFLNISYFSSGASNSIKIPSSTQSEPIAIDVDGDLKIDLLGQSSAKGRGSFQIWQNVWNASDSHSPLFKMCVMLMISVTHCTYCN